MKKMMTLWITFLMILALTACSTGISAITSGASGGQSSHSSSSQTTSLTSQTTGGTSTSSSSAADTLAENSSTHEAAEDAVSDAASAIPIQLNGDSIAASGTGVNVDGSKATITAAGTYSLSGSLTDGQILVNVTGKGAVHLILKGVDLHSSTSAPIYILSAEKVILFLAEGTQNTVTDAENYVFDTTATDEPNAAIFSKSDLSIYGSGSLTVNANYQDGIASKDGLIIANGTLTVTAKDDGIRGKDYLVVKDGSLQVTAQGDGLKSDNEEDATKGYISIASGTIVITSAGDALNAQTDVSITGGKFTLSTGGGSNNRADESTSAKGIKGAASVAIDGGTFTIDSADDSIHSNGSITINGGNFQLASADDAIHADASLTINGGEIQITQSYEGIESAVITVNAGSLHIVSSDDGINGAGGNDGSGMNTGRTPGMAPGGGPGQDSFSAAGNYFLYIRGGYIFIDAQGDGIDVNGGIEMSDGVVLVNGPTEQMNGALDYDSGFSMTGGTIVAVGSSGMALTTSQSSSQNSALIYLSGAQAGGTLIHIQNSTGEDVLTFAPTREYQSIAFSSPKLTNGETYTVFTGGSSTGTVSDGFYQDGTYSSGAQAASFTIASTVTTVGSGGRMGQGQWQGQPPRR